MEGLWTQEASSAEDVPTAERMSLDEFVRAAAPLVIPSVTAYGSAFLLLILLARSLQPSAFGAAAATVVLFLLLSAPAVALQAAIATGVSGGGSSPDGRRKRELYAIWGAVVPFVAAWSGLVAIAAIGASSFLRLPMGPLLLMLPGVGTSLLAGATIGRVHAVAGPRRAAALGLVSATIRVTLALLFARTTLSPEVAVLAAFAVAEPVSLGLLALAGAASSGTKHSTSDRYILGGSLPGILLATVGVAVIVSTDVLLARHASPTDAAGLYAAASTVTKAVVLVPTLVGILVLDEVAWLRMADPFRWLRGSLAITAVSAIVLGVLVSVWREPLTALLLGRSYSPAASLMPFLATVAALITITWPISLFHKTVRSRSHASNVVVGAVLLAIGLAGPLSPDRLAGLMAGLLGVSVLFQYQGARAICRWSPPLSLLRQHEEIRPAGIVGGEEVEVSIILPCRNAGTAVRAFLSDLLRHLERLTSYEVIVVSDGSTDDTVEIAREFASPTLRVFHYPDGTGKGHALRLGLSRANGRYVGYIDSDGDIDPEAIGPFLSLMRLYDADIVLGSKRHPMSRVSYPRLRRVLSWMYHKTTRVLFLVNVRDTQTGFKLIRREVLTAVLPRMLEKRYAFDLELLVVARLLGYDRVFEAPVRINYRFATNVVPTAAFRIVVDTAAIFYRRYVLNTYHHAGDRLALAREEDGPDAAPVLEVR